MPTKRRADSIPPSRKNISGKKSEEDAERRYAKRGKAEAEKAKKYRSPHSPRKMK